VICFLKKEKKGKEILDDVEGNGNWKIWDEQEGRVTFETKGTMLKKDLKIPKKLQSHPFVSQVLLSKNLKV